MSRRSKTPQLRGNMRKCKLRKLLALYGDVCAWCGRKLDGDVTLDHVLAKHFGGGHDLGNLVLAHRVCNQARESHYRRKENHNG